MEFLAAALYLATGSVSIQIDVVTPLSSAIFASMAVSSVEATIEDTANTFSKYPPISMFDGLNFAVTGQIISLNS